MFRLLNGKSINLFPPVSYCCGEFKFELSNGKTM
ncbi:hypothetical protein T11_16595 [Trichinella zimbabwensis]|uniref:Uncharacterized protein n=1 Tax=Trichinella zimbabwensis TaxID=268475 RepID=A0A0V1GYD4_9BILA|nr:hypothetical protein T11_16595 [Trichinella zimbabwensis]